MTDTMTSTARRVTDISLESFEAHAGLGVWGSLDVRRERARPPNVPELAAAAVAALAELCDREPGEEGHDRQEVGDRRDPVAGVGYRWRHVFASDTSHTASSVNPSITPSIQYWERTACFAS